MEFGILLSLVGVVNLILFYLVHLIFKGENPTFKISLRRATQMLVMVDYVREMAGKKSCKYGEYGSFEHLLLLCSSGTFLVNVLFVVKSFAFVLR